MIIDYDSTIFPHPMTLTLKIGVRALDLPSPHLPLSPNLIDFYLSAKASLCCLDGPFCSGVDYSCMSQAPLSISDNAQN